MFSTGKNTSCFGSDKACEQHYSPAGSISTEKEKLKISPGNLFHTIPATIASPAVSCTNGNQLT